MHGIVDLIRMALEVYILTTIKLSFLKELLRLVFGNIMFVVGIIPIKLLYLSTGLELVQVQLQTILQDSN